MPMVETSKGEVFYSDHRKAGSPYTPVVYVHGASGSRLDWPGELRNLPAANAIAIDLPGHGKSPDPGHDTIEAYAAVVRALMDAIDLDRGIIAGHSMGGAIAQMFALEYPERTAGLVLFGTSARLIVNPKILDQVMTAQQEVAQTLSGWVFGPTATDEMRDLMYGKMMALPPLVIYQDYLACNRFDVRDRLHKITAPTLIIGGEKDKMTRFSLSVDMHQDIPNSTLVKVENAGHMMTLEKTEFVVEAMRDWLTTLPRRDEAT